MGPVPSQYILLIQTLSQILKQAAENIYLTTFLMIFLCPKQAIAVAGGITFSGCLSYSHEYDIHIYICMWTDIDVSCNFFFLLRKIHLI